MNIYLKADIDLNIELKHFRPDSTFDWIIKIYWTPLAIPQFSSTFPILFSDLGIHVVQAFAKWFRTTLSAYSKCQCIWRSLWSIYWRMEVLMMQTVQSVRCVYHGIRCKVHWQDGLGERCIGEKVDDQQFLRP